MNSAEEYFGTDFVKRIYDMFEKAEQEGKFVFIHGTHSLDDAINIALNGLECDYPELLYTADLMNKNDKLLFDKLKNWPHWDLKYLLTICVPKSSGKGGTPIWTEDLDGLFHLSPHFINKIIDVKEKSIMQNPKYDPLKNIEATVEDRSYETKTGRIIKISLPQNEFEAYEENNKYEERN